MKYLYFYEPKKEYGWGSNFYKLKGGVLISGELWNDTESYFQAMKFRGPNASSRSIEYSNLIKLADSPMKVKALGSQRKLTRYFTKLVLNKKEDPRLVNDILQEYSDVKIRSDWELAKIAVMVNGLYYKFTQYPVLNKAIKDIPDDALLVEHTTRDRVWGDGGDGGTGDIGTNYLGKILTALSFVLKHGDCTTMSKELKNKLHIDIGSPRKIPVSGSSFVKLDDQIFYGIHPLIVKPNRAFDNYIILTTPEDNVPLTPIDNAIYYPIKDRKAVSLSKLKEIVNDISQLDGTIYIACKGGHGRSGMIAAAVYGKKHGLGGQETLDRVLKQWTKQRDINLINKRIQKLGSPQNTLQKNIVREFLRAGEIIQEELPDSVFSKDGAELEFYNSYYTKKEADKLFSVLKKLPFEDSYIEMFGQRKMPRKMIWYSDNPEWTYVFSKAHINGLKAHPFTDELNKIRDKVHKTTGKTFNSLLVNYYEDGSSSVDWHTDDDPWLGDNITVPSLTFGSERKFLIKKADKSIPAVPFLLKHGSMLLMKGMTQTDWIHSIPKTKKAVGPRINLTFRDVKPDLVHLQPKGRKKS